MSMVPQTFRVTPETKNRITALGGGKFCRSVIEASLNPKIGTLPDRIQRLAGYLADEIVSNEQFAGSIHEARARCLFTLLEEIKANA